MDTIQTTAARRHDGGARWRWLRRKGLGAAGLLALSCLSACGPNVTEPPKVQDWMLGVFSNRQPVDQSDTDEITQYHVYDEFALDMLYFNGIRNRVGEYRRRWEPRGDDSFAMFPAEDEGTTAISEYLVRPKEGASLDCGPYEVVTVYGPESSQPGLQLSSDMMHRGAVCARPYDCTPPPDDPDACWGLAYTLEWCDEPPPPCEGPDG
jgi:hypothetical protein